MDQEEFLKLLGALLKLDQKWIPEGEGNSLYLRPTAIAMDPYLGLQVGRTGSFVICVRYLFFFM